MYKLIFNIRNFIFCTITLLCLQITILDNIRKMFKLIIKCNNRFSQISVFNTNTHTLLKKSLIHLSVTFVLQYSF